MVAESRRAGGGAQKTTPRLSGVEYPAVLAFISVTPSQRFSWFIYFHIILTLSGQSYFRVWSVLSKVNTIKWDNFIFPSFHSGTALYKLDLVCECERKIHGNTWTNWPLLRTANEWRQSNSTCQTDLLHYLWSRLHFTGALLLGRNSFDRSWVMWLRFKLYCSMFSFDLSLSSSLNILT